jgi:hypothetical protein
VRETLRLTLQELEQSAEAWPRPLCWAALMERYVESKLDYRASAETLKNKMDQAGADALELLHWLESLSTEKPAKGKQARLLRRVFEENFEVKEKQLNQRRAQPAGAVQNPHEPEAQWAAKGLGKHKKEHVGYKVQVAETVQDEPVRKGEPTRNFLTAIVTQPASASEDAGLEKVEQEQASMGLDKPQELYVDAGYVDAEKLVQAHKEGRELIGPVQGSPKRDSRFPSEDFTIDISQRQAICPDGQKATNCSRLEERGRILYRFEWTNRICSACARRERCLGKEQKHRTLVVGEHHNALQARRREQKTEVFKEKIKRRNAIEGTHSELSRAHGLKQARYRGAAQVRLQNYLIGAACNAKRWIKRIQWEFKQSALANLALHSA